MNRTFVVLFLAILIVFPVSTFAFVSCRDTDKGCTLEQLIQLNTDASGLGLATAERIAIMQEIIAKLTVQITELQKHSSTNTVSTQCLDLNNSLILGSTDKTTNGEVSKLQQFLFTAGVYPEAQITGYYGNLTAQAVVRWQKAHGMDFVTATSGVGPMTRAKMKCGNTASSSVQKINWNIEKANPKITADSDYKKTEQKISIDVTLKDNNTKRYDLGTAYGCTSTTAPSTQDGKSILGKVDCYYALSSVIFLAYSQNGKFIVERGEVSAKDGSVQMTSLLQL